MTWLDRGDVSKLLRGWHALPWPVRAGAALRKIRKRSALDGEAMSRWLYEALAGKDSAERTPRDVATLMPERHDLELFVTATDLGRASRTVVVVAPDR